jgi:hypothetical protein
MNDAVKNWLDQVTAVQFLCSHIEPIRDALNKRYKEGDTKPDAAQLWDGIVWITSHQEKSAIERLAMIDKLLSLETPVIVDMREFTKW